MILVDLDRVTVTRPERDLLRDVSVTLHTGDRVGVVGINGTGKSTLLRVLAGTLTPESGTVRRGNGVSMAVLDQAGSLPPGPVRQAVGGSWEGEAILDRLGMGAKLDADTGALSGGEARRVALATALVAEPDLLVLDEPTNHLDIGAIRWLEERLATHRGGLLVVAHDRHLLDAVTTRIIELDRGQAHVHEGGYDSYLLDKADREERAAKAEQVRRSLARRELAWLRRGAPARTTKAKARIERATALVESRPQSEARQGDLELHVDVPRLGDKVIDLHQVGHRHDRSPEGRWLFRQLDLSIGPRERLGIVGLNGSGKSTLLDVISGRLQPEEGTTERGPTVELGYYHQAGVDLDPEQRVREAVSKGKREVSWQDKRLLERFWFDDDAQWAPIRLLSGGERRRLQLILVLSEHPNVLLLDEPTNDLDLDTLRALEDFLDDWPGALLVVSHDRAFLERTVDDVVVLDGAGTAGRHPGGYGAWEASQHLRGSRRRAASASSPAAPTAPESPSTPKAKTPKERAGGRSSSTIGHELRQVEKAMARLERQVAQLTGELAEASAGSDTNYERLSELGQTLSARQAELAEAEERWLTLSEELESR